MEYVHILRTATEPEGEEMTLAEMRKTMPPCPICGKKAYLSHSIVDGFDFGHDAGCPSFCLDDGVHGISEPYHQDRPHINGRMPKSTAEIMLRDIQEQREMGERAGYDSLGDPCDVRTWEKFEAWLKETI